MKTKTDKYNELKTEVEEFITEFKKNINDDKRIIELLKGWIISYSNIIEDCKILLMGINPGDGKKMEPFYFFDNNESMPILEYLNEDENKYGLAMCVNQIFADANKIELLQKHTMKSNTHFYATINQNDLFELQNRLSQINHDLYLKLKSKTVEWCRIYIEEIAQPKLIIAEGISAFDFLYNDVYSDVKYEDLSPRNNILPAWKNLENNRIYIGFRRDAWGYIPNFEAVSNEISKYLYEL